MVDLIVFSALPFVLYPSPTLAFVLCVRSTDAVECCGG